MWATQADIRKSKDSHVSEMTISTDIQSSLLQSLVRDLSQKDAAVATLQEKLELLEVDFRFNLGLLAERDSALDQCEAKLREHNTTLLKKDTEISDLKIHLDDLGNRLRQLNDEKSALNEQYKNIISFKDSQLKDIQRNLESVSKKLKEDLAQDHEKMQQQLTLVTSSCEHKLYLAEKEHKKAIEEVKEDYEKEMTRKSLEIDALVEQQSAMETENETLRFQISTLNNEVSSYQKKIEILKSKQERVIKDLGDKLVEKEKLMKKEIAEIHSSYRSLTKTPCNSCEYFKNEVRKEICQVESLKKQMTRLVQAMTKMEEKKDAYIREIEENLKQAKKDAWKLQEQNNALKKAIQAMRVAAEDTMGNQTRMNDSTKKSCQEMGAFGHFTLNTRTSSNEVKSQLLPSIASETIFLTCNDSKTDLPPFNEMDSRIWPNIKRQIRHEQQSLREEARHLIHKLSIPKMVDQCHQTNFQCHCSLKDNSEKDLIPSSDENLDKTESKDKMAKVNANNKGISESKFEKRLLHLEDLIDKLKESMINKLRSKLTYPNYFNGMMTSNVEPCTNEYCKCLEFMIPTKCSQADSSEKSFASNVLESKKSANTKCSSESSLFNKFNNIEKSGNHSVIPGKTKEVKDVYKNKVPQKMGMLKTRAASNKISRLSSGINGDNSVECNLNQTQQIKDLIQENIDKFIYNFIRLIKEEIKPQESSHLLRE